MHFLFVPAETLHGFVCRSYRRFREWALGVPGGRRVEMSHLCELTLGS
jgi:hypothetical protein